MYWRGLQSLGIAKPCLLGLEPDAGCHVTPLQQLWLPSQVRESCDGTGMNQRPILHLQSTRGKSFRHSVGNAKSSPQSPLFFIRSQWYHGHTSNSWTTAITTDDSTNSDRDLNPSVNVSTQPQPLRRETMETNYNLIQFVKTSLLQITELYCRQEKWFFSPKRKTHEIMKNFEILHHTTSPVTQ